jgi:CBS domain containing-hemolysin-like protein
MFGKAFLILLLVGANGFFVAAEFALVKIRLSEIKASAEAGSRSARLVESIVGRLDAYLSACQLGITFASLGLGWVGEPLVARSLEPLFHAIGIAAHNTHYVAFPIAFGFITFLHITVGEQVPKILAIRKHRSTSFAVSLPLAFFYKVFMPFIWVLNTSSNLILRVVGIRPVAEHGMSPDEDELRLLLVESAQSGHVSLRERLIMENVLDLEEKTARSCMLPRDQVVIIDRTEPIDEQLETAVESGHTRLPLCDEDLEHVVGIVHLKDLFKAVATGQKIDDLTPLARDVTFYPETIPLDRLLREFQRIRTMMALLVDEYGVVSGLITLENILEELVGPIQDEFDSEPPMIVQKGPDSFEISATCGVNEVKTRFALQLPDTPADTIGGVIVHCLGYIPKVGEKIKLGRHEIEVLDADARCVRKLLVEKKESSKEPNGEEDHEPKNA